MEQQDLGPGGRAKLEDVDGAVGCWDGAVARQQGWRVGVRGVGCGQGKIQTRRFEPGIEAPRWPEASGEEDDDGQ